MAPIPHGNGARNGPNNVASSARPNTAASSNSHQVRPNSMAAPPNRTRTAAAPSTSSNVAGNVRHATSTSSLRAKAVSTLSKPQTSRITSAPLKQQAAPASIQSQPKSFLASIPVPTFPTLDSSSIHLNQTQIAKRLLQIAYSYIGNNEKLSDSHSFTQDELTTDLISACFYARLSLNCDPASIPTRRLLASLLLQGAQIFPFGPSVVQSGSQSSASILRANAHAAIELLESGPQDIFMDIGCARIFATACSALGRLTEAEEALSWTVRESESGESSSIGSSYVSSTKADGLKYVQKPLTPPENVRKASMFSELGRMSSRTNRVDDAKTHLGKARELDSWSWSSWSGLCDIGAKMQELDSSDSFFPTRNNNPQTLYPFYLEQGLLSKGHEKDFVTQVISHITQQGAEYFTQTNHTSEPAKEGRLAGMIQKGTSQAAPPGGLTARSQALAQASAFNDGEEMTRTASNKRTVAQAITPSSTASSLARPGSRTDATIASKRMRTMPSSQSGQQTQKVGTAINGNRGNIVGRVGTANDPANRPASNLVGAKSRPAPAATTTTAGSVRMTGTLSASRTNEQARPASVTSVSGKSTGNEDEDLKPSPRRSARVAMPIDGQAQNPPLPTATVGRQQRITPATTIKRTVGSRPVMRSIPTSSSSSSDAESVNVQTGGFPSKNEIGQKMSDKDLNEIVQTAALEASQQALEYDAIDAQISELVRTLARAYHAVRNARGRLALALLRPRGTLSKQEADDLLREAVLSVPESERDRLRNQSIQVYGGLSSIHRNCADIQCLLGRAFHDLGRYHLAEKHFLHARHLSPSFISHMDIFSLSLFHLQREVRLSQLVKELQLLDPASSITHIAAGNAFALQHEHSSALRSFQKACSAAPNHAYAFTLAGYEASELGDKEKSMQYFREAIRIERRHWNAYAGIGQLHLQEEKLNAASYYYGQALDLQRSNAVLWDVFGRIKMAQGILGEAERSFECALRLDNNSAMSHIKMAETLLRRSTVENDHSTLVKQHERAHNHLLKAVKLAPDEAHVHLMLAKSYMDKGTGSFATLLRNGNRNANTVAADREDVKDGPEEVSLSELAQIGSGPIHMIMQQQQQIRATGQATLPDKYRAEIAKHLSAAIDLNPRLSRYVKAMGEGARAALRGAAARLTGDNSALSASFMIDQTGMSTEGIVDSMLELEDNTGEHILEDPVSESEDIVVVDDGTGETLEEEEGEDAYAGESQERYENPSPGNGQIGDSVDDDNDIITPQLDQFGRRLRRQRSQLGLGLSLPERTISGATHAPPLDISGGSPSDYEQDVSMSF
ncbi:hypothetical protein L7F22_019562 [Adiantum nelumboides]|nr:hypothetical protein [Adiantum nelumboides]